MLFTVNTCIEIKKKQKQKYATAQNKCIQQIQDTKIMEMCGLNLPNGFCIQLASNCMCSCELIDGMFLERKLYFFANGSDLARFVGK